MMRLSRRAPLRVLIALGVSAAVAIAGLGAAQSASAETTASYVFTKLGEAAVSLASTLTPMAIDSAAQQGYLANITEKSVQVFDLSGGAIRLKATIKTGLTAPTMATVDVTGKRLFVAETSASRVSIIDIDPASATAGSVVSSFPVADKPEWLGVDESGERLFVAGRLSTFVQVFDLRAGTSLNIPAKAGIKDIAVDQNSGTAYFTIGENGDAIVSVQRDGSHAVHPVSIGAFQVRFAADTLIAVGSVVAVIDPVDWSVQAQYPNPGSFIDTVLAVDEGLGLVYLTRNASEAAINVLTLPNLRNDGSVPLPLGASGLSVDSVSHRLLTTSDRITMYSVELRPKPVVERVSGGDRYEVSAAVASGFRPMAPVVYVASGTGFADALSASAVAGAEGGPVLLVRKDSIPDSVGKQLDRLDPQRIVVMGGTASVSAEVERQLSGYSGTVERRSGADRYAVSASASAETFGPSRPVAYIASGEVFSDALSGSAAAGRLGGPVLLAKKDSVPGAIAAELTRLAPAKVVVLGGSSTLSEAVIADVKKASPGSTITRTGGADRYAVSATVANEAFPEETPIAYVASGALFPDALSGSAAAIANGAPVLLVTRTTVPAAIDSALDRLRPGRIVVLGGESSIAPEVLTALRDH